MSVFAGGALLVMHSGDSSSIYPTARDPGVRAGIEGAGGPLSEPGLSARQLEYFEAGKADLVAAEDVADGIGPRMNLGSCVGCHMQPAVGGSSPAINPQFAFATAWRGRGAQGDSVPPFIAENGPVREARFVRNPDGTLDGGVHALFTLTGREGADYNCAIAQPNFAREVANHNVTFRIPTPVFGGGLIEQIPDSAILANRSNNAARKSGLGIRGRANFHVAGRTTTGHTNRNGNDGTISRFGWKAQNQSLLMFAGEAYNVEMGITNELFQSERDETAGCQYPSVPNDVTNVDAANTIEGISGIEKFAFFHALPRRAQTLRERAWGHGP